jgi:anti-sigma regulatory factor (Ser/Thr protein kinase)
MSVSRSFRLGRESTSVARRFVRDVLQDQSPDTLDAVELMVSELATNSIRHARTGFDLSIDVTPARIRVEVSDIGGGEPTLRSPEPTEPRGRGLQIVEAMSASWGVVPTEDGKTVWFTVATQARSRSDRHRAGKAAPPDTASKDRTYSGARADRSPHKPGPTSIATGLPPTCGARTRRRWQTPRQCRRTDTILAAPTAHRAPIRSR